MYTNVFSLFKYEKDSEFDPIWGPNWWDIWLC